MKKRYTFSLPDRKVMVDHAFLFGKQSYLNHVSSKSALFSPMGVQQLCHSILMDTVNVAKKTQCERLLGCEKIKNIFTLTQK